MKIRKAPFYQSKKAPKGKKIEVPAVKAAKKEFAKAEKTLASAKQKLKAVKKAGKKK